MHGEEAIHLLSTRYLHYAPLQYIFIVVPSSMTGKVEHLHTGG